MGGTGANTLPQTKKIKAVKTRTRKLKMLPIPLTAKPIKPRVLQKCAIMSDSELKKMPQKRKSRMA